MRKKILLVAGALVLASCGRSAEQKHDVVALGDGCGGSGAATATGSGSVANTGSGNVVVVK
jgi:hypothetical protein